MSHREKVAWLSLAAIVVTFGPYFLLTALRPPAAGTMPELQQLGRFAVTTIVQMLILGGGHLVLRLREPEEARLPADERDRAVQARSIRIAYFVLITGMILVGVIMPFTTGGWAIVNAALASIVLAEVVQYGIAVWSYRRGWHD